MFELREKKARKWWLVAYWLYYGSSFALALVVFSIVTFGAVSCAIAGKDGFFLMRFSGQIVLG